MWFTLSLLSALAALTVLVPSSAGAPRRSLATITVDTLPIANALPLDLGISKGFFEKRGIEIKKVTLQSGNDIVLALANNNGDIGYIGWVPAFIAATSGIAITTAAASEVEGATEAENWQNVLVKGSSSIRRPQDLAGKTIAVNALKGVSEVVIRASLKKLGLDPQSVRLLAPLSRRCARRWRTAWSTHGAAASWPAFAEVEVATIARGFGCPSRRVETYEELTVALDEVVPTLSERTEPLLLDIAVAPTLDFAL